MRHYKIADLIISVEGWGEALADKMKPYEINDGAKADMVIISDRDKIHAIKESYPFLTQDEGEYIGTGFAFAYQLLDFDGFCLHSSAVALENRAVLFFGPCGSGKSTHASLWQQYFGPHRAVIINDDKPALRRRDNGFYVYGTPWSGKEDLHANIKVPLGAVVFVQQARENKIWRMDIRQALKMLLYQSLRPNHSMIGMDRLLTLIGDLLKSTNIYKLDCNISPEAVELVYNTIYR